MHKFSDGIYRKSRVVKNLLIVFSTSSEPPPSTTTPPPPSLLPITTAITKPPPPQQAPRPAANDPIERNAGPNDDCVVWALGTFFFFVSCFYELTKCSLFIFLVLRGL